MSKTLILTEKPSLGKDVAAALGIKKKNKNGNFEDNDIIVASLVGHVIESKYPKRTWSMANLPLKFGEIKKVPIKGKQDIVKRIKKEVERSDVSEIVNCGDADPEGSLLVYELLEYFKLVEEHKDFKPIAKKTFTRMWILANDQKTIKAAYASRYTQKDDMKFVNTAKARAESDVEIGFNFSQLFTLKVGEFNKTMNIGRVMTPTMAIVRQRELEIENFIPEEFWNVKGSFKNATDEIQADCFVLNDEGKQTTAIKKDKYDPIKPLIKKGEKYKVEETKTTPNTKRPDYLPNLNDILQAGTMFNLNAKKTTNIMQTLYENKYCTYPRSECRFLPTSLETDAQDVLNHYETMNTALMKGEKTKFDVKNKRIFDDSKVESHYAIIPMKKSAADIAKLSSDERKIFDFIVAKFIMSFMKDYKYDSSVIILKNSNGITFKATGQVETQKGFKSYDCESNKKQKGDVILPSLKKDDELDLVDVKTKKDATKPPPALTERKLLEIMGNVHKLYKKQMEEGLEEDEEPQLEFDGNFSLGTSATRGDIIDKLYKIKFLKIKGKKVETTELGRELLEVVDDSVSISTTAQFEEEMAQITSGKRDPDLFIEKIKKYVEEIIEKERPNVKQQSGNEKKETGLKCPICSSPVTESHKVYRCSACGKYDAKKKSFSGCGFGIIKYQKPLNYTLTEADVTKLLNREKVDVKGDIIEYDETSPFFTKITYKNQQNKVDQPKLEAKCPKCSGDIIQSPKLYRCVNTGKWNPKAKKWDGKCDFTLFKSIRELGREIDENDLKDLVEGKEIVNGEKKYKL